MGHKVYKPIKAENFDKKWVNSVTLAEFKKNAIVKELPTKEAEKLYKELTKGSTKKSDN